MVPNLPPVAAGNGRKRKVDSAQANALDRAFGTGFDGHADREGQYGKGFADREQYTSVVRSNLIQSAQGLRHAARWADL
jgi:hypothetical protein